MGSAIYARLYKTRFQFDWSATQFDPPARKLLTAVDDDDDDLGKSTARLCTNLTQVGCQSTVVPPRSSRIRVTSVGTPRSVCPLSSNAGSRPTSEPRYAHHSWTLTVWSPAQLTVVAGTDATSSSFGTVAMMSYWWIGL